MEREYIDLPGRVIKAFLRVDECVVFFLSEHVNLVSCCTRVWRLVRLPLKVCDRTVEARYVREKLSLEHRVLSLQQQGMCRSLNFSLNTHACLPGNHIFRAAK